MAGSGKKLSNHSRNGSTQVGSANIGSLLNGGGGAYNPGANSYLNKPNKHKLEQDNANSDNYVHTQDSDFLSESNTLTGDTKHFTNTNEGGTVANQLPKSSQHKILLCKFIISVLFYLKFRLCHFV
jgi:hypothetical protein